MLKNLLNVLIILITILLNQSINANENSKHKIDVDDVLILDPVEIVLPAFDSDKDIDINLGEQIKFENFEISNLFPSENSKMSFEGKNLIWKKDKIKDKKFTSGEDKTNSYYLAFYINVNRWVKADLIAKSNSYLNIYFDGESIGTTKEKDDKMFSKDVVLETGKHVIIVKTLSKKEEWDIKLSLEVDEKYKDNLQLSTSPIHFTGINELLHNPKISNVSISADGKVTAVKISKRNKAKDADEKWYELYNTETNELIRSYRGINNITNINWAPFGKTFVYSTSNNDKTNLWVVDLEKNTTDLLKEDIKNFAGVTWSPNGKFLVLTINDDSNKKDDVVFQYQKVEDRWPWGNDKTDLYLLSYPDGNFKKITSGKESISLVDINSNGDKIICSKTVYNTKERPYSRTDFYLLDLISMKEEKLLEGPFSQGAQFSPNGNDILFIGGPNLFGNIGINMPNGKQPSDYDSQAYIYNLESKKTKAITKDFDPAISSSYWVNENEIFFRTTDKSFAHLYKYLVNENKFEYLDLGSEIVNNLSFAKNNSFIAYTGESSNVPRKVYTYNLKSNTSKFLLFPEEKEYQNVKLGEVKDWDFVSSEGRTIQGRVYYPPNFNEKNVYPTIVYYYGGTSPVSRNFEGRYPFNIWTANGYLVYVLQPTGAYGYGQINSAVHANDWGEVTAAEVIEGTKKYLDAHKFANPKKVGCMGASYGGFLTLNLITKTDIFAASISHAGISTLTSYWGVGYWGMWYNSVAAMNSFPWNNKKVFVDHSPIYNADKITTPLLLLHGNKDPNVPLGESWSMYQALKLQNKDVELIEISNQEHWIMQYERRIKWSKTILAYFDKYLKDQPEWWSNWYK